MRHATPSVHVTSLLLSKCLEEYQKKFRKMIVAFLGRLLDALFESLGLGQKQGNLLLLGLDNAGKTTLLHRLRTGTLPQNFPPTDRPSRNEFQHNRIHFQAWDLGGHEVVRHLWNDYLVMDDTANTAATGGGGGGGGDDLYFRRRKKKLAILFLLDASDSERLEEAGFELDNLLIHNIKGDEQQQQQRQPRDQQLNDRGNSSVVEDSPSNYGNAETSVVNGMPSSQVPVSQDDEVNNDSNNANNFPPVAIMLNKCDLEDQVLSTEEICQRIDYDTLVQQYPSDRLAIFRISVVRGEGYQEAFQWISTFL